MKRDCLDIGTIQAFLDGELSQFESADVSSHVAACDACAFALADAEEESALVFSALDRELNTLVPTQRLWARINESIEEQRHGAPFWQKVWDLFSPLLMTPSLAAAAAVVIVFGISTVVFFERADNGASTVATSPTAKPPVTQSQREVAASLPPSGNSEPAAVDSTRREASPVRAAARVDSGRSVQASPAVFRTMSGAVRSEVAGAAYLPGEESYVKTIATLSRSVSGSKDSVMRPSEQVAYARDLALVNDSIERMRREVRKHPKNETARQVLYTSYQNKIDLLNSVAQREELVASVK